MLGSSYASEKWVLFLKCVVAKIFRGELKNYLYFGFNLNTFWEVSVAAPTYFYKSYKKALVRATHWNLKKYILVRVLRKAVKNYVLSTCLMNSENGISSIIIRIPQIHKRMFWVLPFLDRPFANKKVFTETSFQKHCHPNGYTLYYTEHSQSR